MSDEETRALTDIRERMVRVETKLDDIIEDLKASAETRDIARDSYKSSKYAHERIQTIEDNQKWLWRSVAGTLIAVAVGLLVNLNGG